MPHFKYLGEPNHSFVETMGKTIELHISQQDGSKVVLISSNPDGFQFNEHLDHDFLDTRALRIMRSDPRFEEVAG